uniref:Exportin-2 n=1 Tax=Psoroptes ovis TaxID=83912 RepID=A0A3B0RBP1_PSOOV|nr:exportin-2 [Psoroptes ovis]
MASTATAPSTSSNGQQQQQQEINLEQLINCLMQTLSPDVNVRKPAELFIESCSSKPGYIQQLLQLIQFPNLDSTIKLCAAIALKNLIKKYWSPSSTNNIDDDISNNDVINSNDRLYCKNVIIDLMLNSDKKIQKQLSEAVSLIGKSDFPQAWPNLLENMIQKLNESCQQFNFNVITGILQTLDSLFTRYQYESKSDKLWTEIKFVLDTFAKTFTELFIWIVKLVPEHINNKQNIQIIVQSLVYCSRIFCSLNSQDLAEFFEDNMNTWMTNFVQLLQLNAPTLMTDSDEEMGELENLKSQICENIALFAEKYSEEFDSYIPGFINQVWTLLDSLDSKPKYDSLVSNAIRFLCIVTDRGLHKEIFEKEQVLQQLCSRVIIPNMQFRESDEELFEDNPEEYIRRDVEGADVQTRRRAACDLVKALARYFEKIMTDVFSKYIETMLINYQQNPQQNWKSKNVAIYLVTSLVIKGGSVRLGTTSTSDLINITTFFNNVIRNDLERQDINEMPVLKADALKYLIVFRNQLPLNEIFLPMLPHIIRHLQSPIVVIHSYAAICIEKLLTLRDPNNTQMPLVKVENIQQYSLQLLEGLFNIWQFNGSSENDYSIKAILRIFSLLRENLLPYFNILLPKLAEKITLVSKNPSKPNFNHYLFETLSLSIRIGCEKNKSSMHSFENILFPIIQTILIQDIQEFTPYVFQILALLLENYDNNEMILPPNSPYSELFPFLLVPLLWERNANYEPLTRLIQAYIKCSSNDIIKLGKLQALLGVFQKLISMRSSDHFGFRIINYLIIFMDSTALMPLMKQVFFVLFQRLTHAKTSKFIGSLLVFFSLFTHKFGAKNLYDMIESLQNRMFHMVLEKLFISEVKSVNGNLNRKFFNSGQNYYNVL